MSKNISKLEMENKIKIEENLIGKIMEYHGDIDKMLPEGRYPKKVKKCMRMDNWVLDTSYKEWALIYHIVINVNMQNIMAVINRVCPFQSFSGESKNIKSHLDGYICLREVGGDYSCLGICQLSFCTRMATLYQLNQNIVHAWLHLYSLNKFYIW